MGYRPGSSGGGGGGSAATGETITAGTVSGSGTVISKNKTISNPTVPANVYLALPSASAAVAYQEYEVKDGSGGADLKPITITTLSGSIDGATEDLIDARWGSKSYYTDGANWFVKNGSTKVLGSISSGSFSYSNSFPGVEEAALPTGWSATTTGTWPADSSGWLHQEGIHYPASLSTSSLGDHYSGSSHGTKFTDGSTSELTYTSGTPLSAGTVVGFKWMQEQRFTANHNFFFKVNGVVEATSNYLNAGNWMSVSFTVPTTGVYIFTWYWGINGANGRWTDAAYTNGCFIDEFTIT